MSAEVINFPIRAPAELEMTTKIKEVVYQFVGRVSIAQVLGCLEIVGQEIQDENK